MKTAKITSYKHGSLGVKFAVLTILILTITLSTSTYQSIRKERQQLTNQLISKGRMLGSFISLVSPDAILSYDAFTLDKYMEEITSQEDVIYGVIVSNEGVNLTLYLDRKNPYIKKYLTDKILKTVRRVNSDPEIISMRFPIKNDDTKIGDLVIGLTTRRMEAMANSALLRNILINAAIILFLGISIYIIFRLKALKPISSLISTSRDVASGNLNTIAPIYSMDELGILAQSFNDMISALKLSYADKDDAMRILRETNTNLEAATKAKSSFLANMSHEIRTPLTAIIGFGETLNDPDIPDSVRAESIQRIIKSGKHLLNIINDILDLSKIEADKLEIDPVETSIFDILTDTRSIIDLQATGKGLQCKVNFIYPLPETIITDPLRLKQILINLASNAVKFTEKGSITLNVSYDKGSDLTFIDVIDTGIGMSTDQVDYVFNSFTQADSSTTRQYGGTGIGLHLSRNLSRMLGGNIKVSSKPGKGSTFTVSLASNTTPGSRLLYRNPRSNNDDDIRETPDNYEIPDESIHVLLAEDNKDNQSLISLYLAKLGAKTDIADNGLEAVNRISNKYDIVLMDIHMPVMDGFDALKKIRESGYTIPVIAITANAMKQDRDDCLNSGFDDFIPKPVEKNSLYRVISKYANTSRHIKGMNSSPIASSILDEEPDLHEIVHRFIGRLPGIRSDINKHYESGNWPELKRVVHSLKGSGGGMGFQIITDICIEIEKSLKSDDISTLSTKIGKLNDIISRITVSESPAQVEA